MIIQSKVFGSIDLVEEYWEKHDLVGMDRPTRCALTFGEGFQKLKNIEDTLPHFLDRLPVFDKTIRAEFLTRYHQGDEAIKETYIEHHFEECGSQIAEKLGTTEQDALLFIAKLELVTVGLEYEEDEGFLMVVDYSIGKEMTQYILAVTLSEAGSILEIEVES